MNLLRRPAAFCAVFAPPFAPPPPSPSPIARRSHTATLASRRGNSHSRRVLPVPGTHAELVTAPCLSLSLVPPLSSRPCRPLTHRDTHTTATTESHPSGESGDTGRRGGHAPGQVCAAGPSRSPRASPSQTKAWKVASKY